MLLLLPLLLTWLLEVFIAVVLVVSPEPPFLLTLLLVLTCCFSRLVPDCAPAPAPAVAATGRTAEVAPPKTLLHW
jgi:hypothetical protein